MCTCKLRECVHGFVCGCVCVYIYIIYTLKHFLLVSRKKVIIHFVIFICFYRHVEKTMSQ